LSVWLALFKANTEEELEKLVLIGGEVMAQAVEAYRSVSATEEFRMLERMRQDMLYNEVTALNRAMRQALEKTAINMLKKGMSVDEISELTGLFIDDILRLEY